LALSEANSLHFVGHASNDITITIPANSSVAFSVGDIIPIMRTENGNVIFAGAVGVTINKASYHADRIADKNTMACLIKRATDTWHIIGNL
jgi:hypothetical protein